MQKEKKIKKKKKLQKKKRNTKERPFQKTFKTN